MITVSNPFQICFSDILVRFVPPAPVQLAQAFSSFLCDGEHSVDAEYEIQLIHTPIQPKNPPFHVFEGMSIYKTPEGWLRIFSPPCAESGCQVACLLRPNGKNILYIPATLWDHLSQPLNCAHLIGLEDLLLRRDAFLLHSSVVMHQGKAVLFCGPSGAGKSTQAALWNQHLGATVLNGDRCVVMKKNDGFYGGGSPLAGSSSIYRREQAPIAGIFLVSHSTENHLRPLGRNAFSPMFSQTLINSWDTDFMQKIVGLFQELICSVPIYQLDCLPDETAVQLAHRTLF